jgi:hypothetical protein
VGLVLGDAVGTAEGAEGLTVTFAHV